MPALSRRVRLTPGRLAILSALGTLVFVEIGFRLFASEPPIRLRTEVFPNNPRGYFTPLPGAGGFGLITDRRLLGCEVPPDPSRRQLLVLGDSFAYGQGVRAEDVFTARLHVPGVQVRNCARPGNNLSEIVAAARGIVARPDVLVYAMVLNDVWCEAQSRPTEVSGEPGTLEDNTSVINDYMSFRTGNFEAYLAARRQELGVWRVFLGLRTVDWFFRRWLIKGIAERTETMYRDCHSSRNPALGSSLDAIAALRSSGGRFVVVLFPLFVDLDAYPFEDAHTTITNGLRRRGVDVIDLLETFRGLDAEALTVHPTDLHPNEVAHRLAADALGPMLVRFFEGAGP